MGDIESSVWAEHYERHPEDSPYKNYVPPTVARCARLEKFVRSLVNEDAEQAVEKAYHDPELRMQWRADHWKQLLEMAALSREARGVLDG